MRMRASGEMNTTVDHILGNDSSYNLKGQEDFAKETGFIFLKSWEALKVEEMLVCVRKHVRKPHSFRMTK